MTNLIITEKIADQMLQSNHTPSSRVCTIERTRNEHAKSQPNPFNSKQNTINVSAATSKIDINLTRIYTTPSTRTIIEYDKKVIIHLRTHLGETINKLIAFFPRKSFGKESKGKIIFGPNDAEFYTFSEFQAKLHSLSSWNYKTWNIFTLNNKPINGWENIGNSSNIIVRGTFCLYAEDKRQIIPNKIQLYATMDSKENRK